MNTFGYTQFSFSTESLTMPMQWYLSGKDSSLVIAMKNNWTMLKTHSQFQSIYHSPITLYKHITVTHWLLSIHTSLLSFLYTKPILSDPIRWTVGPLDKQNHLNIFRCTARGTSTTMKLDQIVPEFFSCISNPQKGGTVLEAMHFWSQGRYLTWWQQQNRRLLKMRCGVQRFQTKSKDGFRTES